MSGKSIFIALYLIISQLYALGQSTGSNGNKVIQVGRNKTTYLIVAGTTPVSADIGGEPGAILYAQQEKSTIIKLKANKDYFANTNMLIVCKDTIFECELVFSANPLITRDSLIYHGTSTEDHTEIIDKERKDDNIATGAVNDEQIFNNVRNLRKNISLAELNNKMIFYLDNIAVTKENVYFKLRIKNNTKIDYEIDYLNFQVESVKHMLKASSSQSLFPGYVEDQNNKRIISAKKEEILVYSLKKFALREDEVLYITLFEKTDNSKGRQVKLRVRAAVFDNVKAL